MRFPVQYNIQTAGFVKENLSEANTSFHRGIPQSLRTKKYLFKIFFRGENRLQAFLQIRKTVLGFKNYFKASVFF